MMISHFCFYGFNTAWCSALSTTIADKTKLLLCKDDCCFVFLRDIYRLMLQTARGCQSARANALKLESLVSLENKRIFLMCMLVNECVVKLRPASVEGKVKCSEYSTCKITLPEQCCCFQKNWTHTETAQKSDWLAMK